MTRVYNFNAGPAALPVSVLQQAQAELLDYQGRGMSILEMSHRSTEYEAINDEAQARFIRLLDLDDDYRVLFMQGGASTQFAMLPLNFLPAGRAADYILTGVWSDKAIEEAARLGQVHTAASTRGEKYRRIPSLDEISFSDDSAYVHLTSNNTIYGTQWHQWPDAGKRPLVADMSSDILSRPFDSARFAMIYAGAQKNLGPAGVTVVILRQSWLEQSLRTAPTMLQYATYAKNNSLYNTPPVFAVYLLNLVLGWVEESGGLEAMEQRNEAKAGLIYDAIDTSGGYYRGHATPDSRSLMNLTFNLADEAQEKHFLAAAAVEGMVGLPGHRSVGGVRASLYNATEIETARALAEFMTEYARTRG